ncbi:MAG TPA: phosphatase PAP2 family protein [Nocardioidaceae bacterium]|nr:phosphatase PAP2 family protein [Nocardioidaceae bacterium]
MRGGGFRFAGMLALAMAFAAWLVAALYDLPLRDPDGFAGPNYLRLPLILVLAFLCDVVPRTAYRLRSPGDVVHTFVAVSRERWPWSHVRFAVAGLGTWYVTYVAFRNLKSFVPFVNPHLHDRRLAGFDTVLFLGNDPAELLHRLLGTGWAGHVMSFIYLAWIVFVPFSLVVALVWSRNVTGGAWYVTAIAVDWALGVATYFAVPSVGPIYAEPWLFTGTQDTYAGRLATSMLQDRQQVLAAPEATHAVQTIAAFASLHVGIMVTVCVVAHLLGLPRLVRSALWVFFALTVVSTVYLGWHYVADALGGVVLGAAGVWIAALATGNHVRGRPTYVPRHIEVKAAV